MWASTFALSVKCGAHLVPPVRASTFDFAQSRPVDLVVWLDPGITPCCKSRFAEGIKISEGRWLGFRVQM
jgi:hypothetical protein